MVIGWLHQHQEDALPAGASAWEQVEAAQRRVRLPCLLIPQPAHAALAGELAGGLTCFGELPPEIQRAIQMHDTGWASSDAQQIQRLRSGGPHAGTAVPVSFIAIPPREVQEAWTASIDTVEGFSRTGAMVVSRHFSLIAQHNQAHQPFLQAEKSRQSKLKGATNDVDIERWTAALGFCDLVSLYLLSGCGGEVELLLAHPDSPQAKTAPRVKMLSDGRNLRFVPQVVRTGLSMSIQALNHPVPAQGPRAETLTWHVE